LAHIPGFSISVNDRMIVFASVGMCALAAFGIDAIDRGTAKYFAGVAAVVMMPAFAAPLPPDYVIVNASRAILPLLLAAAAVIVLDARRASFVLFSLLLIQRGGEAGSLQPTLPSRAFYPPFPGLEMMRSYQPFRIVATGAMLPPEIST